MTMATYARNTYDEPIATGTNREDLGSMLWDVSPTDTPVLTMCGKTKATGTAHDWVNDSLEAAAANAMLEGGDMIAVEIEDRSRLSNYTQIMSKNATVYGSWGRPDMAYFKFTKAILEEKSIDVYNHGDLMRDFTYIDDVVEGIEKLLTRIPKNKPAYNIYNIGNSKPVPLMKFINTIEELTGKEAKKEFKPMQEGDVYRTFANTSNLERLTGFKPKTELKDGLQKFVDWYKDYYSYN